MCGQSCHPLALVISMVDCASSMPLESSLAWPSPGIRPVRSNVAHHRGLGGVDREFVLEESNLPPGGSQPPAAWASAASSSNSAMRCALSRYPSCLASSSYASCSHLCTSHRECTVTFADKGSPTVRRHRPDAAYALREPCSASSLRGIGAQPRGNLTGTAYQC